VTARTRHEFLTAPQRTLSQPLTPLVGCFWSQTFRGGRVRPCFAPTGILAGDMRHGVDQATVTHDRASPRKRETGQGKKYARQPESPTGRQAPRRGQTTCIPPQGLPNLWAVGLGLTLQKRCGDCRPSPDFCPSNRRLPDGIGPSSLTACQYQGGNLFDHVQSNTKDVSNRSASVPEFTATALTRVCYT
jgi:hypothetical protein